MAIQQIQTPVQFEDRVLVIIQHQIGEFRTVTREVGGSQTSGIIPSRTRIIGLDGSPLESPVEEPLDEMQGLLIILKHLSGRFKGLLDIERSKVIQA